MTNNPCYAAKVNGRFNFEVTGTVGLVKVSLDKMTNTL